VSFELLEKLMLARSLKKSAPTFSVIQLTSSKVNQITRKTPSSPQKRQSLTPTSPEKKKKSSPV